MVINMKNKNGFTLLELMAVIVIIALLAVFATNLYNRSINKNELEFAKYLSENNIDIWIRQVLVPGYTDNEEDLKIVKELERLGKMDKFILDYDHELVYRKTLNSMRLEGEKTGYLKGKSEGYASGKSDGILITAKNLLLQDIPVEIVSKATGLSKAKVKSLIK